MRGTEVKLIREGIRRSRSPKAFRHSVASPQARMAAFEATGLLKECLDHVS